MTLTSEFILGFPRTPEALLRGADWPEKKAQKPQRTHWDMLLERRSIPELEELLDESLEILRSGVDDFHANGK